MYAPATAIHMACAEMVPASAMMVTQAKTAFHLLAPNRALATACVTMALVAVMRGTLQPTAATRPARTIATAMASAWLANAFANLAGKVLLASRPDALTIALPTAHVIALKL